MAKALTVDNDKVIITNEKTVSFGNRIIIKSFVRIIAKIARPLLVSISAQLILAAMKNEEDAEAFLHDVLEEVDSTSN